MKLKNSFLFLVFILLLNLNLYGKKLELSINYLGLGVVKVQMEDKDNTLTVTASSTSIANLAGKMNNIYSAEYEGNYLPFKYTKSVEQKDYREDRIINYNRETCIASRVSFIDSAKTCKYRITPESRDFFSALFAIGNSLDTDAGTIWLDANKVIWKANYSVVGKEEINSSLGKIKTTKVQVNFEKVSSEEKERSDMLTNNLVDEDKTLYLWYSVDSRRIPVKAKFTTKPFPVTWNLINYEE